MAVFALIKLQVLKRGGITLKKDSQGNAEGANRNGD